MIAGTTAAAGSASEEPASCSASPHAKPAPQEARPIVPHPGRGSPPRATWMAQIGDQAGRRERHDREPREHQLVEAGRRQAGARRRDRQQGGPVRHARGDVGERQGARPDVGEDRAGEADRHEQVRDRRAPEVAQDVGEVPRARRGVEGRPGQAEGQRRDREPHQGAPDHLAGAGEVVGEVRRAQRERRAVADHQRHGRQEADRVAARQAAGQGGVARVEGQLEPVDREAGGRQAGDQGRPRQHPQAEADHREHDDGEGHHARDVRYAEQARQGDAGDADVDPEPPDHHRQHHDRRGAPAAVARRAAPRSATRACARCAGPGCPGRPRGRRAAPRRSPAPP